MLRALILKIKHETGGSGTGLDTRADVRPRPAAAPAKMGQSQASHQLPSPGGHHSGQCCAEPVPRARTQRCGEPDARSGAEPGRKSDLTKIRNSPHSVMKIPRADAGKVQAKQCSEENLWAQTH